MIKSIKQRMAVYPHPHKKLVQVLISIEDVCSADLRLFPGKTYRLMVGYAVSQNVDAIKFVEYIGIIVLNLC